MREIENGSGAFISVNGAGKEGDEKQIVQIKGDTASVEKALAMINILLNGLNHESFHVSSSDARAIIGRSGKRINDTQSSTGARIKIYNAEDGEDRQLVEIYGDKDAVEKAVVMLNDVIVGEISETLLVSASEAEAMVGEKGIIIKFIENCTGALITVHQAKGGEDKLMVEVQGDQTSVAKALVMISHIP